MTKHTPGPWKVVSILGHEIRADASDAPSGKSEVIAKVARVWTPNAMRVGTDTRDKANAHLLASAPDMLEALRKTDTILQTAASDGKQPSVRALNEILGVIRTAIAKATATAA